MNSHIVLLKMLDKETLSVTADWLVLNMIAIHGSSSK